MSNKYMIKFFRSGLHESGSLIAQYKVDARTPTEALEIARIRLTAYSRPSRPLIP